MKKVFFTVGPSHVFPSVKKHLQDAIEKDVLSMSHRGKAFHDLFESSTKSLKKLLNIPKDYHIFFLSSGTEGMERVLENCVEKKSFHVITGAFGKRFFTSAEELNKKSEKIEAGFGESIDLNALTLSKDVELLALTQNDTSSGVSLVMEGAYKQKKKNPKLLIAVDVVSSIPYVNLDYTFLDLVFFSVQKGFGLPAGLGVIIVSPQALKKAEILANKKINIGTFHNFPTLLQSAEKDETPETPNVLGMYLFEKVLQDMLSYGIAKIRKDTEKKAKIMYDFVDKSKKYKAVVENPLYRSQTTIVIEVQGGSKSVLEKAKKKGIIIGSGYGKNKETQMRIANFPAHSLANVKKLLEVL